MLHSIQASLLDLSPWGPSITKAAVFGRCIVTGWQYAKIMGVGQPPDLACEQDVTTPASVESFSELRHSLCIPVQGADMVSPMLMVGPCSLALL